MVPDAIATTDTDSWTSIFEMPYSADGDLDTNNADISLPNLPNELLSATFAQVGTVGLARLSRVCRRWRTLINDDRVLWKFVDLKRRRVRAVALEKILARSGTSEIELCGVRGEAITTAVVDVITAHMWRISVLEISVRHNGDLTALSPVLLKPAPVLRDLSLSCTRPGNKFLALVPLRLLQDATVSPNLRTARLNCFSIVDIEPAVLARNSFFSRLETLHIQGHMPCELRLLAPALKNLRLCTGSCNPTIGAHIDIRLSWYSTPDQLLDDLTYVNQLRPRSASAGISAGTVVNGADGVYAFSVTGDSLSGRQVRLDVSNGATCIFHCASDLGFLQAVIARVPDLFRTPERLLISAGALAAFPHDSTFFASVREVEIIDVTDTSILCSSAPVARMLATVPRIILRSAPSISVPTAELTWETCVRIFTVLGLHDQPHFPDRLDLYNIELKRPRWVLENGEMEERRFLLRMRMYGSQGNSVRSRSSV